MWSLEGLQTFGIIPDPLNIFIGGKLIDQYASKDVVEPVKIIQHNFTIIFSTNAEVSSLGFRMLFAVIPKSQKPQQFGRFLYNCSGEFYQFVKFMFECNVWIDCIDWQDEENCGYPVLPNRIWSDRTGEISFPYPGSPPYVLPGL